MPARRAYAAVVILVLIGTVGAAWTRAASATSGAAARSSPAVPAAGGSAAARGILAAVPLIDGHNDLPWSLHEKAGGKLDSLDIRSTGPKDSLHTDLVRLRAGGVGGQFWSVYVPVELPGPEAVVAVTAQIDLVHRMVQRYPDALELALTAADIRRIHKSGRVASLIGVEGGHCIDNDLGVLRQLYALGARYMTLTHNKDTDWADSCSDEPKHGGLTPFGAAVVREMNRLGMLVDLSHVSPETMNDALDVSVAPVIFSHSAAWALTDHVRNVPDDVLRRLQKNGGVVMVCFVPRFVSRDVFAWDAEEAAEKGRLEIRFPGHAKLVEEKLREWRTNHPSPHATVAQVADHIDHVVQVAGIDHVGLGSDFDGMPEPPAGLEDVSKFPVLLDELLRRGYTEEQVKKVAGLNALRVMTEVERTSARLQRERRPDEMKLATPVTPPKTH
jgi:membrane dipeptidase